VDDAFRKDLGSQTTFIDEPFQDFGKGSLGQIIAGLTEANASYADFPNKELLAGQFIQVDPFRHNVSSRVACCKREARLAGERLNLFAFDECDFVVGLLRMRGKVPSPETYRSPTRPLPGMARTSWVGCMADAGDGAIRI
jgi:hypothetical protein